jgi:hypothetical protein
MGVQTHDARFNEAYGVSAAKHPCSGPLEVKSKPN